MEDSMQVHSDALSETDSAPPISEGQPQVSPPPAWDSPLPISPPPFSPEHTEQASGAGSAEQALIYLQHLQPFHQLRRKWHLRSGVEMGLYQEQASPCSDSAEQATLLRLFGLLPNGEAWEAHVPMADIIRNGGISMGRDSESNTLCIPDPSVSRVHAVLEITEKGLVISDTNSTNGTALNHIPLSPYEPQTPIQDGDTLCLGHVVLQVEFLQNTYTS